MIKIVSIIFCFFYFLLVAPVNAASLAPRLTSLNNASVSYRTTSGFYISGRAAIRGYGNYIAASSQREGLSRQLAILKSQGRVSSISQSNSIINGYSARFGGDAAFFLRLCATNLRCEPKSFLNNLSKSPLHQMIATRNPSLTLHQINQRAGVLNERIMIRYFEGSGWRSIRGEVGVNGIDGLFIKRNRSGNITDVLFAESKFNFSPLGNTLNGKQMSHNWLVNNVNRLYARTGNSDYKDILRFLHMQQYRSTIWRANVLDGRYLTVNRTRVSSADSSISISNYSGGTKMLIDRSHNKKIDLFQPRNNFQNRMARIFKEEFETLSL